MNAVSEHKILEKQYDSDKNIGIRSCDLSLGDSRSIVWWKEVSETY